jgi:hypothetical protein
MVEFLVTVPGGTGGGYYIDGVQKPVLAELLDLIKTLQTITAIH